ncbi:hypothetical protein BC937DRAFT_92244, partial [Endogone sp. FLAS-F59071]
MPPKQNGIKDHSAMTVASTNPSLLPVVVEEHDFLTDLSPSSSTAVGSDQQQKHQRLRRNTIQQQQQQQQQGSSLPVNNTQSHASMPESSRSPRKSNASIGAQRHTASSPFHVLPSSSSPGTHFPRRATVAEQRKWRWWHYLVLLLLLFAFVESVVVFVGFVLLLKKPPPIRVPLRHFPAIPYHHLDTTTEITISPGTTVYHITKEFGPAAMGGLGMVLTALASAQQRHDLLNVSVVMPYYSFIKPTTIYTEIKKVAELSIDVRDKNGRLVPVEFKVSRFWYVPGQQPPENITVWEMIDGVNTSVTLPPEPLPPPDPLTSIAVYLIGPGSQYPFSRAFKVKDVLHIYSSPPGLPQEWKDQYFCKAVAAFLSFQTASDDDSLFIPRIKRPHVDVVHLHGATNAYVARHLQQSIRTHQMGARPPAIVYTMHDYLDELQYTNTALNVRKFLDGNIGVEMDELAKYRHGHRVFMSSLGIDLADVVTFVSRTMASDMVEGRLDFYLKELVMDSILHRAEKRQFFGITNGIEFEKLNPFKSKKLQARKMQYPQYALQLIEEEAARIAEAERTREKLVGPGSVSVSSSSSSLLPQRIPTRWNINSSAVNQITTSKDRARRFLVRRKLLSDEDLHRPLVLYIGRFQYNKGLEHFATASDLFARHDIRFVIIGQKNNYPLEWVEQLAVRHPNHVTVISAAKPQRQWALFFRAAADFVFVPSLTESFGLVAAEGLLFGASVISSGAGGLREFLIDRPTPQYDPVRLFDDDPPHMHNAYLFDVTLPTPQQVRESLAEAVHDAVMDWRAIQARRNERESYSLRMALSALQLGWEREGGPVEEYLRVYEVGREVAKWRRGGVGAGVTEME